MPSDDVIAVLGGWEGYEAKRPERRRALEAGEPDEVWIELRRLPGPFVCSQCGRRCEKYHEVTERWVQVLPILVSAAQTTLP